MQRRNTNQRQIVYEAIDLLGHSTSDELIEYLGQMNCQVSLATIYRNLTILMEDGLVKKLKLGSSDVYETVKNKHYHFQCKCCKKITDIPIDGMVNIEIPKQIMDNSIEDYDLVLFGTCQNCKNNIYKTKGEKENEKVCM